MRIVKHQEPVIQPPPTFDILGLTLEEAQGILHVYERVAWGGEDRELLRKLHEAVTSIYAAQG